jgi:hypothetical protein
VTWNEWQGGFDRPIAMRRMKIGVTNTTGLGLDQYLANSGRGNFTLPKQQRLSELLDKSGLHRFHG